MTKGAVPIINKNLTFYLNKVSVFGAVFGVAIITNKSKHFSKVAVNIRTLD